jgi:hypothetical protein
MDRPVAIDADDEKVAARFCFPEDVEVPPVKQIKASIGKNDRSAVFFSFSNEFLQLLETFDLSRHSSWVT